jgi:hypothetical protein
MGHSTAEAVLFKSIDYFNTQLQVEGKSMRLVLDKQHFQLRIGKKKNGKPNTDYPSKYARRHVKDSLFTSEIYRMNRD